MSSGQLPTIWFVCKAPMVPEGFVHWTRYALPERGNETGIATNNRSSLVRGGSSLVSTGSSLVNGGSSLVSTGSSLVSKEVHEFPHGQCRLGNAGSTAEPR
jgi:hypothetical protein